MTETTKHDTTWKLTSHTTTETTQHCVLQQLSNLWDSTYE